MSIYDAGSASLSTDGTVTGVGTTWRQPLTLIRVGATMIFNTTPASIVTIAEIISDTEIRVFNDKGFTAPAGTQYSILAHDGITVQGLAQDVAETLRYYQSRETEVAAAVDAFNQFDADVFQQNVTNVSNQSKQVAADALQVSADKSQVSADRDSASQSASEALSDKNLAETYANQARNYADMVGGAISGSFQGGVEVVSPNQQVLNISENAVESYVWSGSLPKSVPENSTPDSTGGVGAGAWVLIGSRDSNLTPEMFGAKGDALLLKTSDLNKLISDSSSGITNPSATDDTHSFRLMIQAQKASGAKIELDGSKGYLISKSLVIDYSNAHIEGNCAVIVYRGGRDPGNTVNSDKGIFQVKGTYDRYNIKASLAATVNTLVNDITVNTAGNTLERGGFALFNARNDTLDSEVDQKIKTEAYYPIRIRKVVNNGTTSIVSMDYKTGFKWSSGQASIGTINPVSNVYISNIILIDEMEATPTPDVLPVPEAPSAEKDVAISLVRAVACYDSKFSNLKSYNAKNSTVDVFLCNNCTFDDIQTIHPVWFGGGEGYSVRVANSIFCTTNRASMIGGRHVTDYTLCAHCVTNDSHGETDQVSFSMHTSAEHDITFNNCTGGDFYLANGVYGRSCCRVTLRNCKFDFVRINCLDLTIDNCYLKNFEATCGRIFIINNSKVRDLRFINKDNRTYVDEILSQYTVSSQCLIDRSCSVTKMIGYQTVFTGWADLSLSCYFYVNNSDSILAYRLVDVSIARVDGTFRNCSILQYGYMRGISLNGLNANFSLASTAAFYSISALDIPSSEVVSFDLRGMNLRLNGAMKPYQVVTMSVFARNVSAVGVLGGCTFINTLQASFRDTNRTEPYLDIVGLSATQDSYNSSTMRTDVAARNFTSVTG